MNRNKHPDLYEYTGKTTKAALKKKVKLTGLFIVCLSFVLFFMLYSEWRDFNDMEQTYRMLKKHALITSLYDAGGKWAVAGGLILSGIIVLITGFVSVIKKNKIIDELED